MKNIVKTFKNLLRIRKKPIPIEKDREYKKVTDIDKRKMKSMHRKGMSVGKIARELDRSTSVITYWLTLHTKDGKAFKLSITARKKAREKYRRHRTDQMRERHKLKPPKNHEGCPVCFEVNIPKGKTLEQVIDEYVTRMRRVNFSQIQYAKQQTIQKITMRKTKVQVEEIQSGAFQIIEGEDPNDPPQDYKVHERLLYETEKEPKFCVGCFEPIHMCKCNEPKGGFVL